METPEKNIGPAVAGPDLLAILRLSHNPHWVANAGITADVEALRAICLHHAAWWNNLAWSAIAAAFGGDEAKALEYLERGADAIPFPHPSERSV